MVDKVDLISIVPEHFHHVAVIHIGALVFRLVIHHIIHVQKVGHDGDGPDGFRIFCGIGNVKFLVVQKGEKFVIIKIVVPLEIFRASVFVHKEVIYVWLFPLKFHRLRCNAAGNLMEGDLLPQGRRRRNDLHNGQYPKEHRQHLTELQCGDIFLSDQHKQGQQNHSQCNQPIAIPHPREHPLQQGTHQPAVDHGNHGNTGKEPGLWNAAEYDDTEQ